MKLKLNLDNGTIEYLDKKPFIQGYSDTQNVVELYCKDEVNNIKVSYTMADGKSTIALTNRSEEETTLNNEDYYLYTFGIPQQVTTTPGQIMITFVVTTSNGVSKFNALNTIIKSSEFESLTEAVSDNVFIQELEAQGEAITGLQQEMLKKIGIDTFGSVKVDELPETGETGILYYVKIENEEVYDVYLWDALTAAFIFLGTTACGLYTQQEGQSFESEVTEEINDFKSDVNDQLDNMTETIEGLGQLQPSGTDTSTNILAKTTASGIWVATDTGHWYYWNGSQYTDGGVYQTDLNYNEVKNTLSLISDGQRVLDTIGVFTTNQQNANWEQSSHIRKIVFDEDKLIMTYDNTESTAQNLNVNCSLTSIYSTENWKYDDQFAIPLFANENTHLLFKYETNFSNPENSTVYIQGGVLDESGTTFHDFFAELDVSIQDNDGVIDINVNELIRSGNYGPTYNTAIFTGFTGKYLAAANERVYVKLIYLGSYKESQIDEGLNLKEKFGVVSKNVEEISDMQLNEIHNIPTSNGGFVYKSYIPNYWFDKPETPLSFEDIEYLEKKLSQVPEGKHFIFITDTHWDRNAKKSPYIIGYLKSRLSGCKVVFGGDAITQYTSKYKANSVLADYINIMSSICGKDFIVCPGNHDINTANAQNYSSSELEDAIIPYDVVERTMFKHLDGYAVRDNAKRLQTVVPESNANYSKFNSYMKQHYYIDDVFNKIRYIVMNTGNSRNGIVNEVFGVHNEQECFLQYDWLYETLLSVPKGYDVVCVMHSALGGSYENKELYSYSGWNISRMLSGAKVKAKNLDLYVNVEETFSSVDPVFNGFRKDGNHHYYDFSKCNDIGRTIIIAGHEHYDACLVGYFTDTSYNSYPNANREKYPATDYSSESTYPDNATITIVTSCDAITTDGVHEVMTLGTITEQSFDIVTITDKGVVCTRVGAGDDREFNY